MIRKLEEFRARRVAKKRAERARRRLNLDPRRDLDTQITDVIADALNLVDEDEWAWYVGRAMWHAYEEVHGWNTANGVEVDWAPIPYTSHAGAAA